MTTFSQFISKVNPLRKFIRRERAKHFYIGRIVRAVALKDRHYLEASTYAAARFMSLRAIRSCIVKAIDCYLNNEEIAVLDQLMLTNYLNSQNEDTPPEAAQQAQAAPAQS